MGPPSSAIHLLHAAAGKRLSFDERRHVARQLELVRLAIETRMDQVSAIKWQIKPVTEIDEATTTPASKTSATSWPSPTRSGTGTSGFGLILEELFVTDAVSLARKTRVAPVTLRTCFRSHDLPADRPGRPPALAARPGLSAGAQGRAQGEFHVGRADLLRPQGEVNTPTAGRRSSRSSSPPTPTSSASSTRWPTSPRGRYPTLTSPPPTAWAPTRCWPTGVLNGLLAGNQVGRRQMPGSSTAWRSRA